MIPWVRVSLAYSKLPRVGIIRIGKLMGLKPHSTAVHSADPHRAFRPRSPFPVPRSPKPLRAADCQSPITRESGTLTMALSRFPPQQPGHLPLSLFVCLSSVSPLCPNNQDPAVSWAPTNIIPCSPYSHCISVGFSALEMDFVIWYSLAQISFLPSLYRYAQSALLYTPAALYTQPAVSSLCASALDSSPRLTWPNFLSCPKK